MDSWMKLYDSSVALLKRIMKQTEFDLLGVKHVNQTNMTASLTASKKFLDPGVDLKWVSQFHQQNLGPERFTSDTKNVLRKSLQNRSHILDTHSKITHFYGSV